MNNPLSIKFYNNLNFTPTTPFGFGFQTQENIAKSSNVYDNVTNDVIKDAKNLTIQISEERIQGFTQNRNMHRAQLVKSAINVANVVNVLGYIPFVGRLIGLIRILAAISTPLEKEQRSALALRGLSELLGYNKIRLAVDIFVTIFNLGKTFANNQNAPVLEKK